MARKQEIGLVMAEPSPQVHGHQGYDLHGLARAGRLFDQDISGRATDIRHQANLVGAQALERRDHTGQISRTTANKHLSRITR